MSLTFPTNPVDNQIYPDPALDGFPQFQWNSSNKTWVKLSQDNIKLSQLPFPIGTIIMWSPPTPESTQNSLPEGWWFCDGTRMPNGQLAPDLRSRFIMGTSDITSSSSTIQFPVNTYGGLGSITLSYENIPRNNTELVLRGEPNSAYTTLKNIAQDINSTQSQIQAAENNIPLLVGTDQFGNPMSTALAKVANFDPANSDNEYIDPKVEDPEPIINLPPYFAVVYLIKYI